jgi:hypothetical protein
MGPSGGIQERGCAGREREGPGKDRSEEACFPAQNVKVVYGAVATILQP